MDAETAADPTKISCDSMAMADEGTQTRKFLLGTDDATIDDRGRVLFSRKKQERLGNNFAMLVNELGCVVCYPGDIWNEKVAEILSYDSLGAERQQYTRLFLQHAEDELSFDKQGRVVVPQKLREIAKLKKNVKVVGAGDRVEIWSAEEYDRYQLAPNDYNVERKQTLQDSYKAMKQG